MSNPTPKSSLPAESPGESIRLVNPTVREYMDRLSLQRFYGGYIIAPLGEEVYNLGIGEVGNIPLPRGLFEVYRRYIEGEQQDELAVSYSGTMGQEKTNRLQAEWLNGMLGVERFNDKLVVSMDGGQNAISVAIRVLTSPLGQSGRHGQYVLLAAPAYPYFSAVVAAHAGLQAFLAYDGEQFAGGVERYCNESVGVILVNVPHNPMGYALNADQVARIDRMARKYDCAILVDIVYAAYADDPETIRALAGFDPRRTIFADSFSKRHGFPGLRLGFALSASPELTYALRFVKMSESLTPSHLKLAFAGHLMAEHGEIPGMIAAEVRRRNELFREHFSPPPEAGARLLGDRANPFYLTLDISTIVQKTGLTDLELVQYCLEEHNVKMFPGSFVYPNAALAHSEFTGAGRPGQAGEAPFQPPAFPPGARIVYAPDFFDERIPLLRLSFGAETRIKAAAQALGRAMGALAGGARPAVGNGK